MAGTAARRLVTTLAPCLMLAAVVFAPAGAADVKAEAKLVGRVQVTEVRSEAQSHLVAVRDALEARFAPAPSKVLADVRIISVRPREDDPNRFDATIYDYAAEKGYDLVLDANGAEIGRTPLETQPEMDQGELRDAFAIVESSAPWSDFIASGEMQLYKAMPAITLSEDGRRLINVGIVRETKDRVVHGEGGGVHEADGPDLAENEVVSVHLPTGEIVRHAGGAPTTSRASLFACGPSAGGGGSTGSCPSIYHVAWPASNPVWEFDAWHPACTDSIQSSGTGLQLQNVLYNGHLVIKDAGVPVLNVLYDGNTCGPYRDWLDSEDGFAANGSDVGSGFRVTTSEPTTFCESGIDSGNFQGVAIYDEGDSLLLRTETTAGWYRYVMEWRFHVDGTIEPIFGFGATLNSCTCNPHFHHAYWRIEFALDGSVSNQSTGINTIERVVPGTTDQWTPISTEGKFTRPTVGFQNDWFRVKNPTTNMFYVIKPTVRDGSAQGNSYAKGDLWALAYNGGESNDPNGDTSINIDPWINGEALGATKRLVVWYRAGYYHNVPGGDDEPCELAGPRLEFSQPCNGRIVLDKDRYGCQDVVNITVTDSDLVGAGSQNVTVSSTSEPSGETVTLTESPAGSGQFVGSIQTTASPATHGDARISVANGETVNVHYVDASACGSPNVGIDKSSVADCISPAISNVQVSAVTETTANVSWTTNENANSRVRYGTSVPPGSVQEDLASYGTSHTVGLSGLTSCTPYVFSVTSSDGAGNSATADAGGSYYAFSTMGRAYRAGPDAVESGSGIWTPSGTAGTLWHIDTCKSSSPTHAWKAGSTTCPGTYGTLADTYLTSAVLSLGPLGHGYHLRYKELYNTQSGADLCTPQISVDGGANWSSLAQYSGTTSGAWTSRDVDLAGYSGSNVRIRFWFHTDSATNSEGWYLDDLEVSRVSVCTAEVRRQSSAPTDGCPVGGPGSANGVIEPGENVALAITAANLGIAPATNLSATLTTTSPGVTITNGSVAYPNIPAGGSAAGLGPFGFTLASGTTCGSTLDFNVRFQSNEGAWSESFGLMVGAGGGFTRTYTATDVPKTINDNTTVTSTMTIADTGTITDVNATVNVRHTFDGDLVFALVSPANASITLTNRRGSGGDNYTNTVFDDEASTPISAGSPPYAGSFRPETLLSALDGAGLNGTWRLQVTDAANIDTGTLTAWSLTVTATTPPVCNSCVQGIPGEAGPISWDGKTIVEWPATAGASWYNLYRGTPAGLPNLRNAGIDSCRAYLGSSLAAPSSVAPTPPIGSLYWYIVTAANGSGEGSPGSGSSGPRQINPSGSCP